MEVRPIDAHVAEIKLIEILASAMAKRKTVYDASDALIEAVRSKSPTLDYEPAKHGEWVEDGCATRCSNCQQSPLYDYFGRIALSNRCPNCGARMYGKAEPIRNSWLMRDDGEGLRIVCSRCGKESKQETPFCAQCGAKMDGGKIDGLHAC